MPRGFWGKPVKWTFLRILKQYAYFIPKAEIPLELFFPFFGILNYLRCYD